MLLLHPDGGTSPKSQYTFLISHVPLPPILWNKDIDPGPIWKFLSSFSLKDTWFIRLWAHFAINVSEAIVLRLKPEPVRLDLCLVCRTQAVLGLSHLFFSCKKFLPILSDILLGV